MRILGNISESEYDAMMWEEQQEFDAQRAQLKQKKRECIETRKRESLDYIRRIQVSHRLTEQSRSTSPVNREITI